MKPEEVWIRVNTSVVSSKTPGIERIMRQNLLSNKIMPSVILLDISSFDYDLKKNND